MAKRVFIIHGWEGRPGDCWYPWLKKQLEAQGFIVEVPEMPDTDEPKIEAWVSKVDEIVRTPDEQTYFVGHSIGCQTILRYLQKLSEGIKIGGVVLVAGWVHLLPASFEEGGEEIAEPWLKTPIEWDKIKQHNYVAIFSDNDPFVPLSDSKIFEEKLGAKIIIEKNKGHFIGQDKVFELPVVLEELLRLQR